MAWLFLIIDFVQPNYVKNDRKEQYRLNMREDKDFILNLCISH